MQLDYFVCCSACLVVEYILSVKQLCLFCRYRNGCKPFVVRRGGDDAADNDNDVDSDNDDDVLRDDFIVESDEEGELSAPEEEFGVSQCDWQTK